MMRDDAVKMIQQVLGFRSDMTQTIIDTMKAEQDNLELGPTKPWFLLSEDSTTLMNAQRVPLPSDFLCEAEDSALTYVPDNPAEEEWILRKRDLDFLLKEYPSVVTVGLPPRAYALKGKYFVVFPDPLGNEYTLRMAYYKKGAVLNSNIENEWLQHAWKLLCGATGETVAASVRDGAALKIFSGWTRDGRLQLFARNEDREHANRDDYQMGGGE